MPVADARTALRWSWRRARRAIDDIAPIQATVGRPVDGQVPPPPQSFARFGDGSWIVPAALVRNPQRIVIGARVVILEHSSLVVLDSAGEPAVTIGDDVRLARFNAIVCGSAPVVLGDGVASSDSATILSTWHEGFGPRGFPWPDDAPVTVGKGAYLGCNSVVWPGVTIGDGAYVGEGAVVVDDVPAHSVVYGNPARVVRIYDAARDEWRRP
jgi:acetyltransferase-like isoleucine patch superfamily enzyme